MTYYDWKKIVKNRSISELKQLIRDEQSSEEAIQYASNELKARLESENNPTQVEIDNYHKRIRRISTIIGVYQLIGGLLGVGTIFYLLSNAQIDYKAVIILIIDSIIILLSLFAGISLFRKQKRIGLSRINQYLQLVHIKTSVFTFSYFSASALLVGISTSPIVRFVFNHLGLATKIEIYWLNETYVNESFIYLNFLSFIVLYYLSKLNQTMKRLKNVETLTMANTQ
jgi:hypothetical protein